MSTLVGVQLSGAAIFAAKKIVALQTQGESQHRPQQQAERTAQVIGEILEVDLLRRFEQMFGMTVGEYLRQREQRTRDAGGERGNGEHVKRPCRVPLSQADGFAES